MTRKESLQYVVNTGGHASVANFIEDWEPVGHMEWELLKQEHLAREVGGKIFLTHAGEQKLVELGGKV